jgi:hypothetical protein
MDVSYDESACEIGIGCEATAWASVPSNLIVFIVVNTL